MAVDMWEADISVERAFAERDWSATPLGAVERWPESLKTSLSIAMKSRFPIIIFWGRELVQLYNQAYRPILGEKHPRALGQRAQECFPEIWNSIGPMLHGVLDTGEATWSEDLMLPLVRDGKPGEYYFTFSYSPITDATGVAGVFCAVAETTASVIQRREAEARAKELLELNRAKSVFLSNISHEFRTPLSLMLAPLAAAEHRVNDEEARESIEVATRNALRLQRLVDSLLAFSRIEAGHLEPRFSSVNIGEFTRDLVASFEPLAASAGLTLQYRCATDVTIAVDREMWERIVFNLLTNALKYTLKGRIDVSATIERDQFVLRVADTGVGVAPDERERIFERFFRSHTSRGRSAEGAGIGLALTRELVLLHHGTVEVAENHGAGSVFTVRLPLHENVAGREPAEEIALPSSAQFLSEAAGWLEQAFPSIDEHATDAHVLVVDDNADLRNYLLRLLESRYRVSTARNGADAIAIVEKDRPDLVVSDVMMPVMDGHELVRQIRALPNGGDTSVILLSARSGSEGVVEGLGSGADDYVSKPFTAIELLARVESQLRLQQARRTAEHEAAASRIAFNALIDVLPAMVWTAAPSGERDFLNAAWRNYTGVDDGASWIDAVHRDDRAMFLEKWRATTHDGTARFSLDYRLWHEASQRYRWVTAQAQRVSLGSDETWVGTTIDIEDRKRRELANEFLARAGIVLNQTLNVTDTFLQLAMLAVQSICDYCIFYVIDNGRIRPAVWLHRDPELQPVLDETIANAPDPNDPEWLVGKVISSNASSAWNRGEVMSRSLTTSTEYDDLVERFNLSSVFTCPVHVGTTVYGAVALARTGDGEPFDALDQETIAQLADRAAIAFANADLYEREHQIAVSFQSAALPDAISTRDGIDIDAHYVAARNDARIGGDWYDTELLPDGRVLVSIGDVSGSGLEAAVVMSMLRTAIRSVAHVYADPAAILEAAHGGTERRLKDHFATVFIGVIDPVLGHFTYSSAGHVRPLLLVDGKAMEIVGDGLPIGAMFDERRTNQVMPLPERCSLIMYTDGLTEGEGEFLPGEEALRASVESEQFRERPTPRGLFDAMLPNGSSDDAAILIAHISLPDVSASTIRMPLSIETGADAAIARDVICETLAQQHLLEGEALENARLIIGELTANVCRHAPGDALAIIDRWNAYPVFHLVDKGQGFRYSNRLPPIFSESGRGLFIASALSRRLEVLPDIDGGSHVIVVLDR